VTHLGICLSKTLTIEDIILGNRIVIAGIKATSKRAWARRDGTEPALVLSVLCDVTRNESGSLKISAVPAIIEVGRVFELMI
jgi:hypothetical protein